MFKKALFLFLLSPLSALAGPFLVCDPYPASRTATNGVRGNDQWSRKSNR